MLCYDCLNGRGPDEMPESFDVVGESLGRVPRLALTLGLNSSDSMFDEPFSGLGNNAEERRTGRVALRAKVRAFQRRHRLDGDGFCAAAAEGSDL